MSLERVKKRVLFFLPLPPPIHGASLINQSLVNSELIRSNFVVNVIPFNFATETSDIGRFSVLKIFKAVQRVFTILFEMIRFRPNLVYFNFSLYGFALYRDWVYLLIFKMFNTAVLLQLRTQGVKVQVVESYFKRMLFKNIFRNTRVLCLSRYLFKDIEDVCNSEPFVVSDGIMDVKHKFQRSNDRDNTVKILFLSNLAKTKGVIELIDTFSILKLKRIPFKGFIVGNPLDITIEELQKRIEDRNLEKEVSVLGPKYGDEKYEILNSADIFILPTYFEAFPGTILEAMQFGLPVISTLEGGIPDMVDDSVTGILVEKKNVEMLAQKLEYLIANPDVRMAMGAKGREKFLQHYTFSILEKNIKATFDAVLTDLKKN